MRLTSILFLLMAFFVADGQKKSYVQPKKPSTFSSKKPGATSDKTLSLAEGNSPLTEGKLTGNLGSQGSGKSQNVTGVWKGYFIQNNLGFFEDRYRFEVQIAQEDNSSLKSVTYSYKTTEFYGKAKATGIFTDKTSNVLLKETDLVDLKITNPNTGACLMTCYMDYGKVGKMETLSGTYTSVSVKDKSDCGSGKVYLEKSEDSDFEKEDFVEKKEKELSKKKPAPKKIAQSRPLASANKPVQKSTPKPTVKKTVKPGAEGDLVTSKPIQKQVPMDTAVAIAPKKKEIKTPETPKVKILPKPDVIKNRINDLVKTITTSEKEFRIDLYDNGDIDGDRISVYHNNELIVSNKLLTDKAISFTIDCDENTPIHEFVMVADNLGSIPPNTSLMIITAGSQRYELTISSTEQKNAVVRVQYKADDSEKK